MGKHRKSRYSRAPGEPMSVTMWIGGGGGERSYVGMHSASSGDGLRNHMSQCGSAVAPVSVAT
jgi:hypothetical protein